MRGRRGTLTHPRWKRYYPIPGMNNSATQEKKINVQFIITLCCWQRGPTTSAAGHIGLSAIF